MKKHTTNYGFTCYYDGQSHEYRVHQISPTVLLEGGYCRSKRDAIACARAAIRRLENGSHATQQQVAA